MLKRFYTPLGAFLFEENGGGGNGGSNAGGTPPADPPDQWTPPTREEYEAQVAETNRAKQAAADADKKRRDLERAAAQGDAAKEKAQLEKERDELLVERDTLKTQQAMAARKTLLDGATKDKVDPDLVVGLLKDEDYKDDRSMTKAVEAILKRYPNLQLDASPTRERGSLPGGGAEGTPASKNAGMNAAIRASAGRA